MIVQSFDNFGEIARFDPMSGTLVPESKRVGSRNGEQWVFDGHYGLLAGQIIVLFRCGEVLNLWINETVIPLDEAVLIRRTRHGSDCTLDVVRRTGHVTHIKLKYPSSDTVVTIEDDPTPFVEEEDFDFGLFVANIANSPERSQRIYRPLSD